MLGNKSQPEIGFYDPEDEEMKKYSPIRDFIDPNKCSLRIIPFVPIADQYDLGSWLSDEKNQEEFHFWMINNSPP